MTERYPPRAIVKQNITNTSSTVAVPAMPTVIIGPNYQNKYRSLVGSYSGTYSYPDLTSGAVVETSTVSAVAKVTKETGNGYAWVDFDSSDISAGASTFTIASGLTKAYSAYSGSNGAFTQKAINTSATKSAYSSCSVTAGSTTITKTGLGTASTAGDIIVIHSGTSLATREMGPFRVVSVTDADNIVVAKSGWSSFSVSKSDLSVSLWTAASDLVSFTGPSSIQNVDAGDYITITNTTLAADWVIGKESSDTIYMVPAVYYSSGAYSGYTFDGVNDTISKAGTSFSNVAVGDYVMFLDGATTPGRITAVTPYKISLASGAVPAACNFVIIRSVASATSGLSFTLYHYKALTSSDTVYVSYRALRTDGTTSLMQIGTSDDITTNLGVITEDNPLALAVSIAVNAAVDRAVYAVRVGSNDADGYADALEVLENYELFNIVPLSTSSAILSLVETHCDTMSNANNQKERVSYISTPLVTEETIITDSGAANTEFDDATTFSDDTGGFSFVTEGVTSGDVLRVVYTNPSGYSKSKDLEISAVTADELTVASYSSYADYNNGTSKTYYVVSQPYTKTEQANEIAATAEGYANRRVRLVWPDEWSYTYTVDESGDDSSYTASTSYTSDLAGYYAAASIASMRSTETNPSTIYNFKSVPSFNSLNHSNGYFGYHDLNTMAEGGVLICVQNSTNGPITIREELTTDLSSDYSSYISTSDALDYGAKLIRTVLDSIAGRKKINGFYIQTIRSYVNSTIRKLVEVDEIWESASISDIEVSGTNTYVTIDVELFNINRVITITLNA